MMFRPNNPAPSTPSRRSSKGRGVLPLRALLSLAVVVFVSVGLFSGFKSIGTSIKNHKTKNPHLEIAEENNYQVERLRLCRDQIKSININTMNYREMFDDLNDIQLEIATKNGLKHPEEISDPSSCEALVKLNSCDLFRVDTMYFSKPYLIPEAVLLLRYIGIRFQEVMRENYPQDKHHYRLVVTSALRSEEDVDRLRHRNRNATEKSCHRFGTTLDISYIRFERDGQEDVNEIYLKNMLALALYELRQEGLCYVKYERGQSCFHLTVRNTEYKGSKNSELLIFPDSAGVELDNWGDDGTLTATEALTREFRQYGTIHGVPVDQGAPKSSRSGRSNTKSTKKSTKSKAKSSASHAHGNTSPQHRSVPAPGKSGEEQILAW